MAAASSLAVWLTARVARRSTQAMPFLLGTTSTAGGSEEEARCVRFLTRITPATMSLSILASDTYRSPRRRTAFERTTAVTMALRLFGTRDLLHDICGRCNLGWHGNSWRHTIGDRHASTGQETAGHTNADAAGMAAADPANSEAWARNSDVLVGVRHGGGSSDTKLSLREPRQSCSQETARTVSSDRVTSGFSGGASRSYTPYAQTRQKIRPRMSTRAY